MSKLLGGPFSRASGKAAGLVFSAARSGMKKKQTLREYVIPANPNTNAQVKQRTKLNQASQVVQGIGREIYQFDFNRAVKQYAGFPSLMSIFAKAIDTGTGSLSEPGGMALGVRSFPSTFEASAGTDEITVTWDTDLGSIASNSDEVVIMAVAKELDGDGPGRTVVVNTSATREDGTATLDDSDLAGVSAGDYWIGMYLKNSDSGVPSRDRKSKLSWIELE